MVISGGSRFREGEKPRVSTFCRINSIFVVRPNESIFNRGIKIDVSVVDIVFNCWRKNGVKRSSVRTIVGEHIFDRMMEIMNVNNRDGGTKKAMRAPVSEPKRRSRARPPRVTAF